MTDEMVDWLVQEVSDLLDVSSVGLYEFLELLNDPGSELPVDRREPVARRALERVLASGADLYWMRWPDAEHLGRVPAAELPPDLWHRPGADGRYVAVDRSE